MTDKRESVVNEWFPVASKAEITPGSITPFELVDDRYVLVCDLEGNVTALPDTCPHRGAQLSLGTFDGERLACPYHGWQFGTDGTCLLQPAHPDRTPPAAAGLSTFNVQEAYGLWWVCLGPEPRNLPYYPAYEQYPDRSTLCDARTVNAAGPRLVENFLDLAHLPYVHEGSLGEPTFAEVAEHEVVIDDEEIQAIDCKFWQPQAGPGSDGQWVTYSFGVSHPYAARLQKLPRRDEAPEPGASFDILLAMSPETETRCRVWMLTTVHSPDADLDEFNRFGAFIFDQDVPIVESQRPMLLPLEAKAEVPQRADRMSLAYRRWLKDRGTLYGTLAKA